MFAYTYTYTYIIFECVPREPIDPQSNRIGKSALGSPWRFIGHKGFTLLINESRV